MNHWPQPLRASTRWRGATRPEPLVFLPLALLAGLLLAPRAASADDAPSYSLTVEHGHGARTVTYAIDDAPRAADYAGSVLVRADGPSRWPGWLTLGVGAIALSMGGGMAYTALQDGQTLHQQVVANPLVYASSAAQQQLADKAAALQNQARLGAGVAAAGLVASGVGAWLLLRQPARQVAVLPALQGAELVVAF